MAVATNAMKKPVVNQAVGIPKRNFDRSGGDDASPPLPPASSTVVSIPRYEKATMLTAKVIVAQMSNTIGRDSRSARRL